MMCIFVLSRPSKSKPDLHVLAFKSCCSLADHIDERTVCNAVSPTKDVDGFHVVNVGRMCLDQSTMLPATPWGVWEIIKRTGNACRSAFSLGVWLCNCCLTVHISSVRYSHDGEERRRGRTVQECGNAHRHVTAHGRPP